MIGLENQNCLPYCPSNGNGGFRTEDERGNKWFCEAAPKPSGGGMCANLPELKKGIPYAPTEFSNTEATRNERMFNNMSHFCDTPNAQPMTSRSCQHKCLKSSAFPNGGANAEGCTGRPVEPPTEHPEPQCTSNCHPEPPCTSNCNPPPPTEEPDKPHDPIPDTPTEEPDAPHVAEPPSDSPAVQENQNDGGHNPNL